MYSVTPTKICHFCQETCNACNVFFFDISVECSAYILLKDNENHNHNDSVLRTSSIFMKNSNNCDTPSQNTTTDATNVSLVCFMAVLCFKCI